jgi:protein O-GlcNAc transferase
VAKPCNDAAVPPATLDAGYACHRAGDLAGAERIYRAILGGNPDEPEALHFLGLLLHQRGQSGEAVSLIARAVELDPSNTVALSNLGLVESALGHVDAAADAFRRALTMDPSDPALHNSLGVMLKRLGNSGAALACFKRALSVDANYAGAHFNLGNIFLDGGRNEDAVGAYEKALASGPESPQVLLNLGIALKDLGHLERAETVLRRALHLQAGTATLNNLGNVLRERGKAEEAIRILRRAVSSDADSADAQYNLGAALCDHGETREALSCFDRASDARPGFVKARWAAAVSLPVIYDDDDEIAASRQRYASRLGTLAEDLKLRTKDDIAEALAAVRERTNFALPYQGGNDLALQKEYGNLIHRIAGAAYPNHVEPAPRRPLSQGGRIRVGFVSSHFRHHTVLKLFGGWIRKLDKTRFEVHAFSTGHHSDAATKEIAGYCHAFHPAPPSDGRLLEAIAASEMNVLVYLDVGMDPKIQTLAALRLAPIQCVAWGHPVTTGLPTMDYFLSSDLMEPVDGADHYSETLVRLPNLSISYPQATVLGIGDREAGPGTVFLCTQSLFKLPPRQDDVFARIVSETQGARIWFISHPSQVATQRFRGRLGRAFQRFGLDVDDHCVFHPRLDQQGFLELNQRADVFLDSLDWSGGNTTLEAVACALPVVTLAGPLMRGRHATAILTRLGMSETIAGDAEDYVSIATRLAGDIDLRRDLADRMGRNRTAAFDDEEPIKALDGFFENAVG